MREKQRQLNVFVFFLLLNLVFAFAHACYDWGLVALFITFVIITALLLVEITKKEICHGQLIVEKQGELLAEYYVILRCYNWGTLQR